MSSSDSDRSEHELYHYAKDKVKLMKETLKIIKPKKIKAMAPDCIKHLDITEINSMLLEELLGISNKRLSYIFNGEDVDRETSSSESDDIISLDDISDDDNDFELSNNSSKQNTSASELPKKGKQIKRKLEIRNSVKLEKEKTKQCQMKAIDAKQDGVDETEKSKLMSVLELLELQARARAIRSQLAIESANSKNSKTEVENIKQEDSDSDAVIIDSPRHNEIVITSESEFENEHITKEDKRQAMSSLTPKFGTKSEIEIKQRKEKLLSKLQKIKLVRHKNISKDKINKENTALSKGKFSNTSNTDDIKSNLSMDIPEDKTIIKKSDSPKRLNMKTVPENANCCDNDEIVINLDEDEMDSMENV